MDWIYRFSANADYPEPVEEISGLSALYEEGFPAFLFLNSHPSPPMSAASAGEIVGLCTSNAGHLILHGLAVVVARPQVYPTTPPSVIGVYGPRVERMFCEIGDIELSKQVAPLAESILSAEEQATFLSGQATAKSLGSDKSKRRCSSANKAERNSERTFSGFDGVQVSLPVRSGLNEMVLGLDPTAATWESRMEEGTQKAMPSFAIGIAEGTLFLPDEPLRIHQKNSEFWDRVRKIKAAAVCIDGPCGTNGPRLEADYSGWSPNGGPGTRDAEVELFRRGVGLYWTTQRTVTRFRGADRWIARSLRLFRDAPDIPKIETHPHGAFTFLWRAFGKHGTPPKKSSPAGRTARIEILKAFLPGLTGQMVCDHDAVDAAVSALVIALHRLGMTVSFGHESRGGLIWMPDLEQNITIGSGKDKLA